MPDKNKYASSVRKFPSSELNEWEGSDKPKRDDFNYDNERLTNAAMWKYQYDPKNTVGSTDGGIAGYSLAKSEYDQDGAVALVGGIQAAIDQAVDFNKDGYMLKAEFASDGTAFMDDTCLIISSVYAPHPTGDYEVIFTAPKDHSDCSRVVIDNVEMAAIKDVFGNAVTDGWRENHPVILARRDTTAYVLTMPLPIKAPPTPLDRMHIRNIYLSTTATWPEDAQDGDILAVYAP